jgi:hypothetical protein
MSRHDIDFAGPGSVCLATKDCHAARERKMMRPGRWSAGSSVLHYTLLACLATAAAASTVTGKGDSPPNWKGSGVGTTRPDGGVDRDEFSGRSTHLGKFTGEGFHALNPLDFTFAGQATWTADDGDSLDVTYTGQVYPSGDPVYPFGFVAVLVAEGGTGRLASARGSAVMTGAFTGVPGELYFDVQGTLHPNGE